MGSAPKKMTSRKLAWLTEKTATLMLIYRSAWEEVYGIKAGFHPKVVLALI